MPNVHIRARTYPAIDPNRRPRNDFEKQFFDDAISDRIIATVAAYNPRNNRAGTNSTHRVYNDPTLDAPPGWEHRMTNTAAGKLTQVHLSEADTRADASVHMILDTSNHARPPMPPAGFGHHGTQQPPGVPGY